MMKTTTLILIIVLFLFSTSLFAQSNGNAKEVPFQLTFITPLGTNGTNAGNCINKVSFNILAGYAGGMQGVEFAGIANANRDFINGAQLAGIGNYTGGNANGAQFSGIGNINIGDARIAQFAGIGNLNAGSTQGFQGAGIWNYTSGNSKVVQAAGILNIAEYTEGAQMAGIGNVSATMIDGAQLAGIFNVAPKVKGAQIAGIVNIAEKVSGLQLGLINIADTVENGIPIGFVSIVQDGFYEFEVGFSEGLNTSIAFKLGVNKFYNIFSIGTQFLSDQFRWGVGYGIGTHLKQSDNFRINLEAISTQINEGSTWTEAYNGLQQIKLTFAGGVNPNVQFYAGPTFNLMVSDYTNAEGEKGSDFPPYYIIDGMSGNTELKFWIGFSAGIRIH